MPAWNWDKTRRTAARNACVLKLNSLTTSVFSLGEDVIPISGAECGHVGTCSTRPVCLLNIPIKSKLLNVLARVIKASSLEDKK